jgi:tetratricopeptide (TPR) repeat protein
MNYGNTLMAKGDFAGALDYFHRAQQLTPQYSVLLINLAIAEDATKQSAAAEQHFKDALRLAPASPDSYTYYARYLLAHSRPDEARAFLNSALELSPTDLTGRDLLEWSGSQSTGHADSRVLPRSRPSALSRRALRRIAHVMQKMRVQSVAELVRMTERCGIGGAVQ